MKDLDRKIKLLYCGDNTFSKPEIDIVEDIIDDKSYKEFPGVQGAKGKKDKLHYDGRDVKLVNSESMLTDPEDNRDDITDYDAVKEAYVKARINRLVKEAKQAWDTPCNQEGQ